MRRRQASLYKAGVQVLKPCGSEKWTRKIAISSLVVIRMELNSNAKLVSDTGLQLRIASERGKRNEVKQLIAAGAPVTQDSNGLNALHKAAKCGHNNVIKELVLSKRFSINMQDKYGWTALHWAAWNGHVSTIRTVVAHSRGLVSALDKTGSNAMHCAALKGHSEVVRVLTPMNGDVNHQRKDGWTPLHLACWNGHHAMVRELIINKCKVNIRTNDKRSALHLAALKGYGKIVQELLDAGVAIDMQDKDGNTALHYAAKRRHAGVVCILMQYDCRINVRNEEGLTPMDIAKRDGCNPLISQLSGLDICNISLNSDNCYCNAIHPNETIGSPKSLSWSNTEEVIPNYCYSTLRLTSSPRDQEAQSEPSSWQEKLEQSRAQVLANCESRIAELELQCRQNVAKVERQCSQRLQVTKDLLIDSTTRILSAPQSQHSRIRTSKLQHKKSF